MDDVRSELCVRILNADPDAYTGLLGPSQAPAKTRELLGGVQPEQLLGVATKDRAAAAAMLAGLWLWHDGLYECHEIVQKSPDQLRQPAGGRLGLAQYSESPSSSPDFTPTLSLWHAIMHRREGDFSNSKYWLARCRNHPVYPILAAQVGPVLNPMPANKALLRLTAGGTWNPEALVDLVENVHEQSPEEPLYKAAVAVQKVEWRVLFDHCTRIATG
jgi:hypothetical protein